jgi:hypothetical protein
LAGPTASSAGDSEASLGAAELLPAASGSSGAAGVFGGATGGSSDGRRICLGGAARYFWCYLLMAAFIPAGTTICRTIAPPIENAWTVKRSTISCAYSAIFFRRSASISMMRGVL